MTDYAEICAMLRNSEIISSAGAWTPPLCIEAADAIEALQAELHNYKNAEEQGRLVVLPNRECLSEAGNTVYLIYDDEIIEAVHCGLSICPVSGKLYVTLVADERIFPYREGDAEYDLEQSDWCTTNIDVEPSDFGKTVFLTREAAEAKLKEMVEKDKND